MNKQVHSRPTWRIATVIGVAAAVVVALAGCSSSSAPSPGGDSSSPYKIGLLTAMTGSYAAYGDPQQKAVELYLKLHPKLGGHPVQLVTLDSQSDAGAAVNQYRKLVVDDKVHVVVGPASSGESIAIQPFSLQLTTPTMSLASSDAIVSPPDKAKYMFKEYQGSPDSMAAQLQFSADKGWTKAAMLYTNDGYGQDAAALIDAIAKKSGVTVTDKEAFDPTTTDVTAQLGKISTSKPDVLLVWAGAAAIQAVVAKSAQSISFAPQIFASPGAGSPAYISAGGAAVEGALLQGSVVLAPDSLAKDNPLYDSTMEFETEYKKAYGEAPSQYAANAWDGMTMVANAIEKAKNGDPANLQGARNAIRDSLENNTKDLVGVNAIYTFTPDRHASSGLAGLAVLQVENGKFKVVKTY